MLTAATMISAAMRTMTVMGRRVSTLARVKDNSNPLLETEEGSTSILI